MVTVDEVLGRIGTFLGAAEQGSIIKMENLRKCLSFNHKQLHLTAPAIMRDHGTTYEHTAVKPATATDPAYLELTADTIKIAKEITGVAFLGTAMAPYQQAYSIEAFAGLKTFDEGRLFGRWWLQGRGKKRILIFQGTSVTGETSLAIQFVKEVDTSNYDLKKGSVLNLEADFDCPPELIELLVLTTAKDLAFEQGAKSERFERLSSLLADQKGLITQLDTLKSQQLANLEQNNRDTR